MNNNTYLYVLILFTLILYTHLLNTNNSIYLLILFVFLFSLLLFRNNNNNNNRANTTAKVFTVTKDEYDLIEDFINYNSYLFGVNNVYIIDNGSTHPKVLEVYDKFISKGGTIYKHLDYTNGGQGEAFTKFMNIHKNDCKYLFGLDTDEFICLNNQDNYNSCDRDTIIKYLENLSGDITMLKISKYFHSVVDIENENYINNKIEYPCRNINYFKIEKGGSWYNKWFFKGNSFISAGVGNHNGTTLNEKKKLSKISYYHFNSTGTRRLYERAYNVLLGYHYINHNDTLKEKINILQTNIYSSGIHRVKMCLYYFLKEYIIKLYIQYLKRLPSDEELYIYIPNIQSYDIYLTDWKTSVNIDKIEEQLKKIEVIGEIPNINYDHLLFYETNINKNEYFFDNNLSNCLKNIQKIV